MSCEGRKREKGIKEKKECLLKAGNYDFKERSSDEMGVGSDIELHVCSRGPWMWTTMDGLLFF